MTSPVVRNYSVNNLNQLVSERGFGPTTVSGTIDEAATVSVNGAPAKVTSSGGVAPYLFEAPVDLVEGTNVLTIEASDGSNNTQVKQYEVNATGEATQYVYDADGNLRFEKEPNGDVRREYHWDAENRLTRVVEGAKETRFAYNGASRRTRIRGLEGGVEVSNEVFTWCRARICQKRDSTGSNVQRAYLLGGLLDGATKGFLTGDHIGSTREVVAADGMSVETSYDYSLYGVPSVTGGGLISDTQYTGHPQHMPTGITLTLFRAYSSREGRWLSRDPLEEESGLNLYGYVGGRPVDAVDLFGLDATNSTDKMIYIKPGESGLPLIPVKPGETYYGEHDGVTHPDVPGKVFKTVNGIDVECKPGGKVTTSGGTVKQKVGQVLIGGWKERGFTQDSEWNPLFDKAGAPLPRPPKFGRVGHYF